MFVVSKRKGEILIFIQKIKDAIDKAFTACKRKIHPSIIDDLSQRTKGLFAVKLKTEYHS